MIIRLYMDEDAMDADLVRGIRARRIDTVTAYEMRMIADADEEHAAAATQTATAAIGR